MFSAVVRLKKSKLFHFLEEKMAKNLAVSQKTRYFAPEITDKSVLNIKNTNESMTSQFFFWWWQNSRFQ